MAWLGVRYIIRHSGRLSDGELRLLNAVGRVVQTRHEALRNTETAAQAFHLFRGLHEDRFVSAFLDPEPYASTGAMLHRPDRVSAAIEVLRLSALATYENRHITTGALLLGRADRTAARRWPASRTPLVYDASLTAIKSFYRMCDGLRTLAVVDRAGRLAGFTDLGDWTDPHPPHLPVVPVAHRYASHSLSTAQHGHLCLALTPAGEIKIFAGGTQAFRFVDGQWRLSDMERKYRVWERAVGARRLARRLFQIALDMAEDRHGGLFVLLDDPCARHPAGTS